MASKIEEYKKYAESQVDEQAILNKYNRATMAQFAAQRMQNEQAENQFYNQMYNTQRTAMDTIRNTNAAAVATGASRGVQAAQELSALLGLQQESVASATEIAQTRQQTAQEETAAVLENVLQAYQQAANERAQIVQQQIEAASVDAQREANEATIANTTLQVEAQREADKKQHIANLWNIHQQAIANGDVNAAKTIYAQLEALGATTSTPQISGGQPGDTQTGATGATGTTQTVPTNVSANLPSMLDKVSGNPIFNYNDLTKEDLDKVYPILEQMGFTSNAKNVFDIDSDDQINEIAQKGYKSGDISGEAANYIAAIKADATAGNIPVGAIVQLTYGPEIADSKNNYTYMYLGGSYFAKVSLRDHSVNDWTSKYGYWTINGRQVYVPSGYTLKRYASVYGSKVAMPLKQDDKASDICVVRT